MGSTATVNGKRLKDLRGKRSREWVAHELRKRGHATDAKAIWRWENGRNQPSSRVLHDLADVLGAGSVDSLYGSDDEEEAASMPPNRDILMALHGAIGAALGAEARA